MFGFGAPKAIDVTAKDVKSGLDTETMVLIDVREPDEHRSERIKGAIPMPLSNFDPKALPDAGDKMIVLHCAGGVRSAKAVALCRQHGVKVEHHLAGGLSAWKANGLPTQR